MEKGNENLFFKKVLKNKSGINKVRDFSIHKREGGSYLINRLL
jgi:hypothetical protein